ncbi:hypothetical protein ACFLWX_02195 [Chloroflexota bacterium]
MARYKILLVVLLILSLLVPTTSCLELEEMTSTGDSDGDGWSDTQEQAAETDPENADTDCDGYWDPHDPNPLDPNIPVEGALTKSTPNPTATPTLTPTPSPTPKLTIAPESPEDELNKVQDGVRLLMKNNNLTQLANPVTVPTNDMRHFPDATTRHGTAGIGYVLYLHDYDGDGSPDINYIRLSETKGTYVCDEHGNVTQMTSGHD